MSRHASDRSASVDQRRRLNGASTGSASRDSIYPTKVDWWVGVTLVLTLVISLFAIVQMLLEGGDGSLVGAVLTTLVLVGCGLIMVPIHYRIGTEELVIRSGVWRIRVPLEQIRRVYPSRSLLSSPALSMDRLAVEYTHNRFNRPTIYISPARKAEFVHELAAAAGLVPDGDAWIRAPEA